MKGHIAAHGEGRWRLFVYAGRDAVSGKRKMMTKVVRGSRREAETVLAALVTEVSRGEHATTGELTFGEVLAAFVDHKSVSLEETSAENYRWQVTYIPPRLADLPLHKLTTAHLETFYLQLRRSGRKRDGGPLSAKAIRNIHAVIHGALEMARRRRWVAVNPAADAEAPAVPRREPTPVPTGRFGALLQAAAEIDPLALPAYLRASLVAGTRRSEMHGLRWSGVDFDRGAIVLRDTVVRGREAWIVKPRAKTGAGRVIDMDLGTMSLLRDLYDRAFERALACGVDLEPSAFVFSDDAASRVSWCPTTTAARFSRACRAAGIPPSARIHDLRHSMATALLDEGHPLPAVAARLGHARNSTTLDLYAGRIRASDREAAEIMARLLEE